MTFEMPTSTRNFVICMRPVLDSWRVELENVPPDKAW
jgi:hypothetical protein